MRARRTGTRPRDYAVVWRDGGGPIASGRLEVADDELVLHGGDAGELRIPLGDLASVEVGRGPQERINGEKSVVLERHSCERVLIGALGGIGFVGELTDLLARLRAERTARARVALVAPLKPGAAETARRLIEAGPPFEIEQLGLERHHVFVSKREVVFLFEGEDASAIVDALSRSPRLLKAAVRWRRVLAGEPRLATEQFSWTRAAGD
jgi:hypothetical protein